MKLEPDVEETRRAPAQGLRRPDDLLTVGEVADYLGLAPGTIRNFISQGRIPYIKISGGNVRIRWSSLQDWLHAQERAPLRKRAPVRRREGGQTPFTR